MKSYTVEPLNKKSVLEYQTYSKKIEDGCVIQATLEIGWRTGEFTVHVPETEEEVIEWANGRDGVLAGQYTDIETVLNDNCVDCISEMEFLPSDSEDETFHEMSDFDFDMESTWDGCWEDWTVTVLGDSKDSYDTDKLCAEIAEGWSEGSWDYMEDNGFDELECYWEIVCPVSVKESVDE